MINEQKQHGATVVVGMTGQTGAGKTVVSGLLTERGLRVLDADLIARQVVMKGNKCLIDLAIEFGIEILSADGTLNRRKLGNIVFGDKAKQAKLNRITFPYIQEEIFAQLDQMRRDAVPYVFLDAPTLLESGTDAYCDMVVSVIAPAEIRLQRIMQRDAITEEDARRRMSAQQDDAFYTSRSTYVLENGGDLSELRVKVLELLESIGANQATLQHTNEV